MTIAVKSSALFKYLEICHSHLILLLAPCSTRMLSSQVRYENLYQLSSTVFITS